MAWPDLQDASALVATLLHTLWQGGLAAAILYAALSVIPARRASLRYAMCDAAIALTLIAALGTWAKLDGRAQIARGAAVQPIVVDVQQATPDELHEMYKTLSAKSSYDSPSPAATPRIPSRWPVWIAALWLAGVLLFMARGLWGIAGAELLRRRCKPRADHGILAMAGEMRARLRLWQRVRLLVSDEIRMPCVIGVIWPVVLIPASLVTGVSPDHLRAILSHELAHIRRWDYLANLAQIVIEALLFFNPFVWWISRQMRIEREACCDALAAAQCESPRLYVEALLGAISLCRTGLPETALAAAGPAGTEDAALDRARRLLLPGYAPAIRLRWFSLVLLVSLTAFALLGFGIATRTIAQSMNAASSHQSSVQYIDSYNPPMCEITISTAEGHPAAPAMLETNVLSGSRAPSGAQSTSGSGGIILTGVTSSSGSSFTMDKDGPVKVPLPQANQEEYITIRKKGYARFRAGPFSGSGGPKLAGLHITLQRGFDATFQVVNSADEPVPGVRITVIYSDDLMGWGEDFPSVQTDKAGVAVLHHVTTDPFSIVMRADGYRTADANSVTLSADKPYRQKLKAMLPQWAFTGVVVSASTGDPIAGARITRLAESGPISPGQNFPGEGPLLATAGSDGHFTVALHGEDHYALAVDADGYSGVVLNDIREGNPPARAVLGPPLYVRGKVINPDPAMVKSGLLNNNLMYEVEYQFEGQPMGGGKMLKLENVKGEMHFSIGPIFKLPIELMYAGWRFLDIKAEDLPHSDVVFDLSRGAPRLQTYPKGQPTN